MKRLIIGTLSALFLSAAIAPVVRAETVEVTPAQLLSLAENGYLQDQGIPRAATLINEYQAGRITARDLVQAAIRDGRLTPDTLNNREYLNAVAQQAQGLYQGDNAGNSSHR
jgi:hypothetical protein